MKPDLLRLRGKNAQKLDDLLSLLGWIAGSHDRLSNRGEVFVSGSLSKMNRLLRIDTAISPHVPHENLLG